MNKLMARIFAVVMVVVMLGTVSFAATSEITDAGNLDSTVENAEWAEQAVVTVLAFATTDENAITPGDDDKIIAIHQGTSTDAVSIPVNKELAEDYSHVVVLFGGDATKTDRAVFALEEDATLTVTPKNEFEFGGKKYINVVFAEYEYTAKEATTVNDYGFKFGESTELLVGENAGVELEAGATLKFSAVVLAVPTDKQNVTVEAIIR